MAAPSQPITKYNELYDLLCKKMQEDSHQHNMNIESKTKMGISADDLQALFVAHREKWAFMEKMIAGMKNQKVSEATLKEVRAILGDELDQYL